MDNTVEICRDWIKANKERFIRTDLITVKKNTGVAPNINRGNKAASGEWLKVIAGDDILLPDAIHEYVDFVLLTSCQACWARTKPFGSDIDIVGDDNYQNYQNKQCQKIDRELKYQKREISRGWFISGTGLFYSKKLYNEIGGLPEEYPFADEWPFISKIIYANNKVYLINKYVVGYRVVENSLSHTKEKISINDRVFNDTKKYFYREGLLLLLKRFDILYAWHILCDFQYMTLVKRYQKDGLMFKMILLLSPVKWMSYVSKFFSRRK
jgi:alpha-1,3-rhamnosyltransferase